MRCRVQVFGTAWHHRRSRSVRDDHQHCPCNGITLCATCHAWVHAHPLDARRGGWIVSRAEPTPWKVPCKAEADHWMNLDCFGGARHATADTLEEAIDQFHGSV